MGDLGLNVCSISVVWAQIKMSWLYKIATLQLVKPHKAENNFLQVEEDY